MNSSNSSCPACWASSPPVIVPYLGCLLALGLPLNGAALWVLCRRLRVWTETRVYMANLALADLCLLCTLPFFLHSLQELGDTAFCRLSQGVYLANRYMSIGLTAAIALDRYVAVRHPLRARGLRSPRQALAVCLGLWALVAGSLLARGLLASHRGGFCFSSGAPGPSPTVAFSLVGFYPPLAVLAFCSLGVVAGLVRRPPGDPAQARASCRAARMVLAHLAVFLVCFLPLHAVLTACLALGTLPCGIRCALAATAKLSDANCCLDAVSYYYMASDFRQAARPTPHRPSPQPTRDTLSVTVA
ncbi:G-protein coupled receptor 35 [Erinaceus europaeus]|uniref:G-protein coupled receptor 35 n=1 Tax=Erinaceus europaeus TaxID=9365 RepID=A0ABM3XKP1_ERIEU|nr:G-protein coupled receptor 35 [Erinaceus europaeus]